MSRTNLVGIMVFVQVPSVLGEQGDNNHNRPKRKQQKISSSARLVFAQTAIDHSPFLFGTEI